MLIVMEESRFWKFSNYVVEEMLREGTTSCCHDPSGLETRGWIVKDEKELACESERKEVWLGIGAGLGLGLGLGLLAKCLKGVGLDFTMRISLQPPLPRPLPELVPNIIAFMPVPSHIT